MSPGVLPVGVRGISLFLQAGQCNHSPRVLALVGVEHEARAYMNAASHYRSALTFGASSVGRI